MVVNNKISAVIISCCVFFYITKIELVRSLAEWSAGLKISAVQALVAMSEWEVCLWVVDIMVNIMRL